MRLFWQVHADLSRVFAVLSEVQGALTKQVKIDDEKTQCEACKYVFTEKQSIRAEQKFRREKEQTNG
jgi:hypothetical protein